MKWSQSKRTGSISNYFQIRLAPPASTTAATLAPASAVRITIFFIVNPRYWKSAR